MPLPADRRPYEREHGDFRQSVRRFLEREVAPYFEGWEAASIVDRSLWLRAGEAGMLCPQVPEELGGTGDFRYNAVFVEECSYAGFAGPAGNFTAHSDVACGYLIEYASDALKGAWLPAMMAGEAVCAIAMTEPDAGSDLQGLRMTARREGAEWVLNGQKTFISNGQHCDIVLVVARTSSERSSKALSLFLVEADRVGFERGRNLAKLGLHSADTSELSFTDVRIPDGNLLGEPGGAMGHLMRKLPYERIVIAIASMAAAQRAFDLTVEHVRDRHMFGTTLGNLQNTRFQLADLKADLTVGWAYIDECLLELTAEGLSAERASVAKLWATEMHGRVVDRCLQFFGGYGLMAEYEISRLYADARVQRIYGGASEVMREVIARSL
jgi:long-chain-acyl-CoA dehydrogenase